MDTEQENYNHNLIEVGEWFGDMEKTGEVRKIDQVTLNITFDSLGGSLEIKEEEEKSLKEYTNKASKEGMIAIWGESRMKDFNNFCKSWIVNFENTDGNKELPKLDQSGKKNSGMKQFFHEVTAYAYGIMDEETFGLFTETRIENGKLWQEGKKDQREKLETPSSKGEKILISSIPPGFIPDFWNWLKTSKK
ncbi:MAG TPA: hypothetical protein VL401_03750 [Alphaproteobacteria bacterium]|jgi:hypothetical protein|nr:hypothetical protein [Alphaproteobacteria bacterium]